MADAGADEYKKKGNEAFKNGDWDEAIKQYNKAISLDPNQAAFYSNRAACWSSKGNHESALADAKKCLDADPAFIKGYSRKGKALFDLQRLDEAEEAYQEGLKVDPTNQGCISGLADVKAGRAQANRARTSGSGSFMGSFGGGFLDNIMGKLKQGGLGGRMQMYMVAFAAYYAYKNFVAPTKQSVDQTSTHEPAGPDYDDEAAAAVPSTLRRSFSEVSGGVWAGYLEAAGEAKADTTLVFLHNTASSAEVEFGGVMPRLLEKASSSSHRGSFSLFAPDRPCHGYSPCSSLSGGDAKWLQGLLKSRRSKHMAYVASGLEAAQMVLELVRQRKEPAQVLLLSPRAGAAADAKSLRQATSAAEVGSWLQLQPSLASAHAAADATRWAVATAASSEKKEVSSELDVRDLPEGCSVTILAGPEEAEDKRLQEELEMQGLVVRGRKLQAGKEGKDEEVAGEAFNLLESNGDA